MRNYLFSFLFLVSFCLFINSAKASYLLSIQERQVPREVIKAVKETLKKCNLKSPQVHRITYSEQEIMPAFNAFIHFYTYEFNGFSVLVETQFHIAHDKELILSTSVDGINCN